MHLAPGGPTTAYAHNPMVSGEQIAKIRAGIHATDATDPLDLLRHLVLPALVLGLGSIASWSRYLRSSLLEVMHQPYIAVARAKGNSERGVLLRHALRNALIPLVTVIGLD